MNRTTITILVIFGLFTFNKLQAQQSPNSNFYNFNNYLLNPAEAGHLYRLAGTASHRIQWQGIEGAPQTTFLGIHGAMNDKMGIGGKVTVDQTDILKQFNAALSYSYGITINENTSLRFGLSGMMVQNSINYNKAIIGDYADEVATGGSQSGTTFDAEAGFMLAYKKGKIGAAASHLFESDVNYKLPEDRGDGTFERVRYSKVYASYTFSLTESWNLEPFVLLRNQGVESMQMEVNALASWKETLHLGMGFRQEAGYIAKLGFQITDQLIAAYAYEFSNTGIANNSNGSHELMIGLKMCKKKKANIPLVEEELVPAEVTEPTTAPELQTEKEEVQKEASQIEDKFEQEPVQIESMPAEAEETTNVTEVEVIPSINQQIFEQKISFEFDQITFNDKAEETLNRIAAELKKFPNQHLLITGHSCDLGNDAINQRVSLQRAQAVENYLIAQGVNQNQLSVKAMADSMPIVPNTSISNKQKNRRVELELQ